MSTKKFFLIGLFFLALSAWNNVKAHSVQVGYCVNCNGDLRVWVEHWHGTENPANTTMNIELNVNGNITFVNGSPDTSVLGVPIGQLPGCFTPMNVFAQCQGTGIYAPNSHNDWVAYDFPGVQCGVNIEITVISGNTVFTQDCGNPVNMFPASSGQFVIPCQTNQLPDDTVCSGQQAGPYVFPAGNTWTNDNPAIGLPAAGNGDVGPFTSANVAVPTTGNIVVNNLCGTETFSITVLPGPIADFQANYGCSNATPVSFVNNSSSLGGPILSYTWDFGDGSPVFNGQNPPPHLYPGVGPYNVTLTVTTNGCTDDTTITINFAPPVSDFTFSSPCFGAPTQFTDNSLGGVTQWAWDFDNDGVPDDVTQNPSYSFPSAGTFPVTLISGSGPNCVDTVTLNVTVNPLPVANFSVDTVCLGGPSTFTDLSNITAGNITTWFWDFGDGVGTSNNQNPTYTYPGMGVYPVTLTVTSDSGCTAQILDTAYVNVLPTAGFNTNNVCENQLAMFTDASNANGGFITNWDWDFENDGIIDDNNQNPTHNYAGPGTYNVSLIVSAGGGCSDTIVQPIDIYEMPIAAYTFNNQCFGTAVPFTDNSSITNGNIVTWAWDFDNGNTSAIPSPAENYGSEGVYNVELIVTSNNGCSDTLTQTIEVYPIPVVNFTPTEVCLNTPTQFNDLTTVSNANTPNNIVTWAWDFGDGTGTSAIQNPVYTYNLEGTYPVMLSVVSNNGCTHDTTIDVTVNPLPVVDFTGPADGCAPVCNTFTNNSSITIGSIATWDWDFGDGGFSAAMDPTHCFQNESHASPRSYDVTLTATSDKGCVTSLTQANLITVYPIPQASFTFNPPKTDIYDPTITFTDQSIIASQWDWDLGDGNTSTEQSPVHMYADSGTYPVTLYIENQWGCRDTARHWVIIDPTFALWIPNAFTPDGDDVNEMWGVEGYGIEEIEIKVFDRWGMVMFEAYDMDKKWNGVYKGKMSVTDVYVYRVHAKDVFGEWHEYVGKVTLIK